MGILVFFRRRAVKLLDVHMITFVFKYNVNIMIFGGWIVVVQFNPLNVQVQFQHIFVNFIKNKSHYHLNNFHFPYSNHNHLSFMYKFVQELDLNFNIVQLMQTNKQTQSRSLQPADDELQKTGIQSIDKFFNYGEKVAGPQKIPFVPLIHQVIDMFQSEYTESLHDRKAKAIIKFCEQRPQGFFYEEVEGLTKLFEYAKADLDKGVEEMIPALQQILSVDCIDRMSMFNRNASSDQLRYIGKLPAFLTSLEPFLRYQQWAKASPGLQSLRESVVDYLRRFAERQIPEILSREEATENGTLNEGKSPLSILAAEGTKQLRAICDSKVLQTIVQLLYDYRNQNRIIYNLFQLLSFMMMYCKLAQELCRRGALHLVMEIMLANDDFRSGLIRTGFQILWSAIEEVGVECLVALSNQDYVTGLQKLLVKVVKQGYKLQDKCLRNQIVILVNYLLSIPQLVPLFLTRHELDNGKFDQSFLEILFKYATIDQASYESKTRQTQHKVQFGTNAEDLELKKLLWSGLLNAIQSRDSNLIIMAKNTHFIRYLLLYIDSANTSYAVTRWSGPQLRELQGHALSVLYNVILHMKDDFQEKKGIFCLTKFLSNASDMERRYKCLKAFSNASLFEEAYKIKISQEGVIDYLLQFLQGEENPIQIKELCLTIIANLCNGCKKNKKLFRQKHGVDILITYLKDPNIASSNRYVLLGLALLNALWNAVLGSRRSQQRFLSAQGLFDLLEFIEACDYVHRKMALSCLSFLTQNAKAVTQFLQWNGQKTMVNATQLMIRLYSEEDQKYGVKYEQGVVTNYKKPLTPQFGKKVSSQPAILKDLTQAGTETYLVNRIREEVESFDMRLIVFSILYRVGFARNDLTAYQQQKLQVIQMYPHFKMGEVWEEIKKQMQLQGVQATEDDHHWMATSLQEFQQQMNNCINTQKLIMKQFNKNQEAELSKFYQVIKHNKQIK